MIKLAIAGQSAFAVDDREFRREGPSYTIDTLAELERDRPQDRFTLLLGTDQLPKLHTWHKIEQLLAQVPVAILGRSSNRPFEQLIAPVEEHLGSSTAQRFRRAVLLTPLIDISANDIRRRVREDLPISHLVPESVAAYIASNGLYR
jgi:nicotinate-nucleotide adenylyltransferase